MDAGLLRERFAVAVNTAASYSSHTLCDWEQGEEEELRQDVLRSQYGTFLGGEVDLLHLADGSTQVVFTLDHPEDEEAVLGFITWRCFPPKPQPNGETHFPVFFGVEGDAEALLESEPLHRLVLEVSAGLSGFLVEHLRQVCHDGRYTEHGTDAGVVFAARFLARLAVAA